MFTVKDAVLILAINHNAPVLSPAEVFCERNVNSLYPIYGRQKTSHFREGKQGLSAV